MEEFGFSIGNLNITVAQENGCRKLSFDPAMTHFSSAKIDKPDIYYEISSKTFFPSNDAYAVKFQTKPEGIWTIFQNRTEKSYLIRLENIDSGPPFLVALADEKFSKFEIYPGDRETFVAMVERSLRIGFYVRDPQVQQVFEQHVQTVSDALAGVFDQVQISTQVSREKIAQFEGEDLMGPPVGRIDVQV